MNIFRASWFNLFIPRPCLYVSVGTLFLFIVGVGFGWGGLSIPGLIWFVGVTIFTTVKQVKVGRVRSANLNRPRWWEIPPIYLIPNIPIPQPNGMLYYLPILPHQQFIQPNQPIRTEITMETDMNERRLKFESLRREYESLTGTPYPVPDGDFVDITDITESISTYRAVVRARRDLSEEISFYTKVASRSSGPSLRRLELAITTGKNVLSTVVGHGPADLTALTSTLDEIHSLCIPRTESPPTPEEVGVLAQKIRILSGKDSPLVDEITGHIGAGETGAARIKFQRLSEMCDALAQKVNTVDDTDRALSLYRKGVDFTDLREVTEVVSGFPPEKGRPILEEIRRISDDIARFEATPVRNEISAARTYLQLRGRVNRILVTTFSDILREVDTQYTVQGRDVEGIHELRFEQTLLLSRLFTTSGSTMAYDPIDYPIDYHNNYSQQA